MDVKKCDICGMIHNDRHSSTLKFQWMDYDICPQCKTAISSLIKRRSGLNANVNSTNEKS